MEKSTLTPPQQQLVDMMHDIGFGRIHNIIVKNGDPVVNTETIVEREFKLGTKTGTTPGTGHDDYILKDVVVELVERFRMLGNGTVRLLEVKHGLPFLARIEERAHL